MTPLTASQKQAKRSCLELQEMHKMLKSSENGMNYFGSMAE
jgi:hypothetical protein